MTRNKLEDKVRICAVCKELSNFNYDKSINHGKCQKCGNGFNNIKLTRKKCKEILILYENIKAKRLIEVLTKGLDKEE